MMHVYLWQIHTFNLLAQTRFPNLYYSSSHLHHNSKLPYVFRKTIKFPLMLFQGVSLVHKILPVLGEGLASIFAYSTKLCNAQDFKY